MSEQQHVDGLTGKVFATEQEYLDHISPVTGFTPKDLEHHGSAGLRIAEAALKRTGSLTEEIKAELESKQENVTTADLGLAEVKAGRGPDLS